MKGILALLVLFLTFSTEAAAAPEPLVPVDNGYGYFLTTSIFPLDQGILEWTIIPIYTHGNDERTFLLAPQVTYGITESWLIGVSFIPLDITRSQNGCGQWETSEGIGDTTFITQYSWLYINQTQCSASVVFNLTVPTGDVNQHLSDGLIHYTPSFILAKDFIHNNWRTQLYTQVAASFVQQVKQPRNPCNQIIPAHEFMFAAGIAERSEKINYSLEFNWFTNTWNHDGDDDEKYITPGVYIYVRKDVAIGLGIPIGLTQDSDNFQIIGNLQIDIETIWKKKSDQSDPDKKTLLTSSKKAKLGHRPTAVSRSVPLSAPAHFQR